MKRLLRTFGALCCALFLPAATQGKVLDNFDDNTKTGWTDFTFQPGFGLPVETGGAFRFEQPPAGTAIFSATQKTTESFELKEGRTIELRVDVTETGGKDSFAILSFIPTGNSPGTLSGYGLAKSTTDVLMTKGINRYFLAEGWPPTAAPEAPSQNVTLVLIIKASGGNVSITGKILDKSKNDAVVWERTVIDTPNADLLIPQGDQPKEPFLNTSGYFTLYLYQDFSASAPENPYFATFDNAKVFVSETVTVDDFNDNSKTGWTDFTFQPGFGLPAETASKFRFEQPPAGTAIFSASQKTSRTFDLKDGERLEFSVDVDETGAKDSFAIVGFIPVGNSPGTLSGYGLAKSITDVLMTKGINRYFAAEGWPPAANPTAPSAPITLVLSMAAANGNVTITGKILDKANTNAVLWEKTVIDTPNADLLIPQGDQPKEPFINVSGYFTLYLYQDFAASAPENPYFVVYDNAMAVAPPVAANTAPIISEILPEEFRNFLPATTSISFKASDDKPLADGLIAVTLNGVRYATTNGLTLSAAGNARTATLSGKLASNTSYVATLEAADAEGEKAIQTIYFDTFLTNNILVEVEDYNYGSGSFLNAPVLSFEDAGVTDPVEGSYRNQTAVEGVDFHDTRTAPRLQDAPYRKTDPIRMVQSLDYPRANYVEAGGAAASIFDYDVGDYVAGEWMNYTRTFPAGSYEVYLRQSVVNLTTAEATLEMVTSDRAQTNQTTRALGSFLGARSGFKYRNTPLTDGSGASKVVLRLSGETTLRLRENTTDPEGSGLRQNYLIFVPVADTGVQRAAISAIAPAPNSSTENSAPQIRVEIQNRDTTVNVATIKLELNGQVVAHAASSSTEGSIITHTLSPLPVSGATNTARISFKDNEGADVSSEWSFVINYKSVNPAGRLPSTAGNERGFAIRVVQAPQGSSLANSLQRAEDQLAPNSTIEKFLDVSTITNVINFNKVAGGAAGNFPDDLGVPGIDAEVNGDNDFAVAILTYLDLPAGVVRFGVVTDDGYQISTGLSLSNAATVLEFHSDGTADESFDVVVPTAGLYPFRMVWYERGGGAHAEWFSINPATGVKTLINDPNAAGAIKAYTSVTAPSLAVQSSATVNGTYTNDSAATLDTSARRITVPVAAGANRFFRLSGAANRITSATAAGGTLTFTYQAQ